MLAQGRIVGSGTQVNGSLVGIAGPSGTECRIVCRMAVVDPLVLSHALLVLLLLLLLHLVVASTVLCTGCKVNCFVDCSVEDNMMRC